MMTQYFLAIDIGASSGRHILAHREDGKMILEEIHRFPNGIIEKNGHMVWDVDRLFSEIKTGMKKCVGLGKIPVSVGIDTWAVDFVLLDGEGNRITDAVAYRDGRTEGMDEKVYACIPESELYARTGIQKQKFNTIYQLMAMKCMEPGLIEKADTMLMIPDYFHYLLTGQKAIEYTNASTTQLVSPQTKQWDMELIDMLGYPKKIFAPIVTPGTCLGELTGEMQEEIGYNCKVVLPGTHDTASAVIAVPAERKEDTLYISSGTWSLMGTELTKADCSMQAQSRNFTNEGGYDYRFRFLKNIMGLWMIQSVKKEIGQELSFGEICAQASRETITSRVDCNADRFLAPVNMTKEVQNACRESGQQVPEGIAQVASVIYNSLADCYRDACEEIEELTGKTYDKIRIVGGGSNAEYLNELTAKASGKAVYAGPTEATAIGNLAAQMIAAGELQHLEDARDCIARSFPINVYQ
jgi:rhamnulokinase